MLEVLNQQFAEYTMKATDERAHFIQELESLAKPIYAGITNDKEALSLNYLPSFKFDYAQNEAVRLEEIMFILSDNMQREKERGISLFGSYRDDISFDVNGVDAQTYGSQEQQRTTALPIKLAETELMSIEVREYPILLLDDVLSESGDLRQTYSLSTIQHKVQIFVITTPVDGIDHEIMNNAKLYRISQSGIMK